METIKMYSVGPEYLSPALRVELLLPPLPMLEHVQ